MTLNPYLSFSKRQHLLDCFRLLAAVLIVWMHTMSSDLGKSLSFIGRMGVPFFVATSVFFTLQSAAKNYTLYAFFKRKLLRLGVPFLVWSTIYLIARLAGSALFSNPVNIDFRWSLIWTGTAHHLWFLPFIFLVNLIVFPIGKILHRKSTIAPLMCLLFLALGIIWSQLGRDIYGFDLGYTFGLGHSNLPSVFLTISLYSLLLASPGLRIPFPIPLAASLVGFIGCMMFGRDVLLETLWGTSIATIGICNHSDRFARFGKWGTISFCLYLSHVLFVEGLQDIFAALGMPASFLIDLAVFALSVLLSSLVSILLARLPIKNWFGA